MPGRPPSDRSGSIPSLRGISEGRQCRRILGRRFLDGKWMFAPWRRKCRSPHRRQRPCRNRNGSWGKPVRYRMVLSFRLIHSDRKRFGFVGRSFSRVRNSKSGVPNGSICTDRNTHPTVLEASHPSTASITSSFRLPAVKRSPITTKRIKSSFCRGTFWPLHSEPH